MTHRLLRAALVGAMLTGTVFSAALADPKTEDPVVARVNGQTILRSNLMEAYQGSQFRQVPLEMVYDQVLDYVVTSRILLTEAEKAGLEKDAKVKEAVKAAQARILQQAYLSRKVDEAVTEKAVRARYDELVKASQGREEVQASHILVESEDKAKEIIAKLKAGADFETLAKAESTDPSVQQNGGDLGYFGEDEMVPEFAKAAFAMKKGEISQTPVKTQFGYHVIRVQDRRKAQPPTFEQSEAAIKAELSQEMIQKVIEDLRKSAKVERFDIDGKPLAAEGAK